MAWWGLLLNAAKAAAGSATKGVAGAAVKGATGAAAQGGAVKGIGMGAAKGAFQAAAGNKIDTVKGIRSDFRTAFSPGIDDTARSKAITEGIVGIRDLSSGGGQRRQGTPSAPLTAPGAIHQNQQRRRPLFTDALKERFNGL